MNVLLGLKLTSYKNMTTDVTSIAKVSSVTNLHIITDYKYKSEVDGVKYHYLPYNISKVPIIRFLYRIPLMIFVCKKYRIDVLIGYHLTSYGLVGFIVSRLFNIPISMHFLGNDLDNYCKNKYIGWLFLWFASRMDQLTVQGNNSKLYLEQKGITNVAIIPTVCDIEEYNFQNITKEFDLIFIGRLSKEKRPDRFVEIVKLIKQKNVPIRAVILGTGVLEKDIKKQIRKNNLENNVYLAGWQDDITNYLNKSKIFMLTSDYDQLPLALLEAMAMGLVPLAANVGNISDVVNEDNGYLIDKNNLVDFVNVVIALLNNQDMYKRRSSAASEKIRKEFSIPSNTKRWENIMHQILKNRTN
jgi:glycosyltransferase involved in cell wall biosynthesis